jgi:hypothetical protein
MFLPLHIVTSLTFAWDEALFLAVPGTVMLGMALEKLRMRRGAAQADEEEAEVVVPAARRGRHRQ